MRPPRARGMLVERRLERHQRHLVVRAVAGLAGVGLALRAGQLAGAPQRVEIGDEVTRLLAGAIGCAVEQRAIGRHHRVGHDRARGEQMRVMPVAGARAAGPRQVGADAARAPQVGIVEAGLPGQGRGAEPLHVGVQVANLLGVAVSAALAAVDGPPAARARAHSERLVRRHQPRLLVEHALGPHAEERDRHHEERDTGDARHQVGHAQRALRLGAHATSTAAARPGATSASASSPMRGSMARMPAPRGPVVRPVSSAMKPAVSGIADSERTIQ